MTKTRIAPGGSVRMIDVSGKDETLRTAVAGCRVVMKASTMDTIKSGAIQKGNVYEVAKVAGIMAAKNTPALIPLCHPLRIQSVDVTFHHVDGSSFDIRAEVKAKDVTGVEMEALAAVAAAALCVYDMCKYLDQGISIENIRLLSKSGGKTGQYVRADL